MTIEQSKEKLKKEGYTWFELNEFDPEFYNWLLPLKCNKENNLKNKIKELRMDMARNPKIPNHQIKEMFETHDLASEKKNWIVNEYKHITNFSQIWYYGDLNTMFNPNTSEDDYKNYKKYVKNIVNHFFDFEKNQQYSNLSFCTYYDEDCHLQNHSDGTGTGRVCALLIYLNETYDEKDGGVLVLNNTEKVIPTFGKVAMIDLQTFDIPHMVTKVTGGIGRYAILSFVKKTQNEFK
jgi:Rps23 Pro-64 3,4-dihydroxylase Tpa1-like proline 4-hydroxylase